MDGVEPAGNDTVKIKDNDPMNITGYENFDLDMGDDSIARVDHELQPMNAVEDSAYSVEKMDIENNLGFEEPDVNPKPQLQINSNSQNNIGNASSPPRTPQSPHGNNLSPDNNLSDCGSTSSVGSNFHRASDLLMAVSVSADVNKMKINELVVAAMEELRNMAIEKEPLWRLQQDGKTEILNDIEYMGQFGHVDATLKEIMRMVEVGEPHFLSSLDSTSESSSFESVYKLNSCKEHELEPILHTEASRETGHVRMNPVSLVGMLMDLKQWSLVFANIVSKAMILGVLSSTGKEENYDGTLQVMTSEFHVPSPLVPVRESYFARYCKQLGPGTWGVVDVSLENMFKYPSICFRRRPSGCLIQAMPNGYSKVIWVEHVEVDNGSVHNMFQPLVASGFAYSAKRWINTIHRQCERFATLMAKSTPTNTGVLIPQDGRTSLLKLSERMMRTFCVEVCASASNIWISIPKYGAENIKIMTKYSVDEPGIPSGPSVVFATSARLPASRKRVFNYLRHENSRNKWDILSYGHTIRELAYVINGEDPGNRISIIQVLASPVMYLQESYSDSTGSYVVYAPMDSYAMSIVLNGGDPDIVAILPSGFAILPDRPTPEGAEESGGSLLTVGFHIIDGSTTKGYIPPESIDTMHQIMMETVFSIRTAMLSNNLPKN